MVLADVLRHGRVRRRHDGDAAQTWHRLPGDGRISADDVRRRQGRADHDAERALHLRARHRRSDLAARRAPESDVRGPRQRRVGGADGGRRRQLRLSVRLGVQRCSRDRGACRCNGHRCPEGRKHEEHGGPDCSRGYPLRYARGAEPRRREPRPLLQFPARPRRRRLRQQLQSGHLPPGHAACRLAPPQHLRRRAQDCRVGEGR